MSAKELCDMIGINQPALNKIYDRNSTKKTTLEKIASALKISVEDFYSQPKNEEVEFWKQKYYTQLEENNKLLRSRESVPQEFGVLHE